MDPKPSSDPGRQPIRYSDRDWSESIVRTGKLRLARQFDAAEKEALQAIKIADALYPITHLRRSISYEGLASVYIESGKLGLADESLRNALSVRHSLGLIQNIDTARIYTRIGRINLATASYPVARIALRQAVESVEKIQGNAATKLTAESLLLLSIAERWCKDSQLARTHVDRAMALVPKLEGKEQYDVLKPLQGAAGVCYSQGDFKEALRLHLLALKILDMSGVHDPNLRDLTEQSCASLRMQLGFTTDALETYERVKQRQELMYPPLHPELVHTLRSIAAVHNLAGNFHQARKINLRLLSDAQKAYGKKDVRTTPYLCDLAHLCRDSSEYAEGLAWAQEALILAGRTDFALRADIHDALADMYHIVGQSADSRDHALFAIANREELDAASPALAVKNCMSRLLLASLALDQNDMDEANEQCRLARADLGTAGGLEGLPKVTYMQTLGRVQLRNSEFDQAKETFNKALEAHDALPTAKVSAIYCSIASDLAIACHALGEHDESIPPLREAKKRLELLGRDDSPIMQIVLTQLINALNKTGGEAEAKRLEFTVGRIVERLRELNNP